MGRGDRGRAVATKARRIRYAVIGQGYISQVAVLPAFAHASRNSELVGLFSDDPVKLKKLAKKYGVERACPYDELDACLEAGSIDALYIALPNHMHRYYAVRAMRAGVHVLCEKPMALSEDDCESMIRAAEEAGVKLMIAYRLHFEAANLEAVSLVKSGKLGEPRIFDSVFTMQVEDSDNIRLKVETGGGPLDDIGIYCVNAARYLFRDEPTEVFAVAANSGDKRFAEVDEMVSAILRFPKERLATFTCSFGAADVSRYEVVGTRGDLQVEPAYEFAEGLGYKLTIEGKTRRKTFPKSDQFAPLLLYFSDCILKDRTPEPSGREGLADVRVLSAIRRSLATGRPVPLGEFVKTLRPTKAQEIARPPVRRPGLIRAKPPSKP
jgi:predicted dehydrogenase